MTNTQLLIKHILETGTQVEANFFELNCTCSVVVDEDTTATELFACDDHADVEAAVAELGLITNEKDDDKMTIALTATRKKMDFAIAMKQEGGTFASETVSGYKVEASVDVPFGLHKSEKVWVVSELLKGSAFATGSTMKDAVLEAEGKMNRIGLVKFHNMIATAPAVEGKDEVIGEETTLEDLLATEVPAKPVVKDDAPFTDEDAPAEQEENPSLDELLAVEAQGQMTQSTEVVAVDAKVLAQQLLDLLAKGTNFSTLAQAVRENATAIVNGGVVKSEPKKTEEVPTEQPKEQPKKQATDGASEASAFTKFKSAAIITSTATSVTFKADGQEYIFLKNEAGRTLIRKVGSNSNSYMSTGYMQSLIYDINTQQSRALFRKVKAVGASKAQAQGAGAASEASAKEKDSAAKNNSAEVITMQGVEIPKAWFTSYVNNTKMKTKHGKAHLLAKTIIMEFNAKK